MRTFTSALIPGHLHPCYLASDPSSMLTSCTTTNRSLRALVAPNTSPRWPPTFLQLFTCLDHLPQLLNQASRMAQYLLQVESVYDEVPQQPLHARLPSSSVKVSARLPRS